MAQPISERELRNDSGEIMRRLDRGETFTVTRNGVPVGELRPIRRQELVAAEAVAEVFAGAPAISRALRDELDLVVDQDATPPG